MTGRRGDTGTRRQGEGETQRQGDRGGGGTRSRGAEELGTAQERGSEGVRLFDGSAQRRRGAEGRGEEIAEARWASGGS